MCLQGGVLGIFVLTLSQALHGIPVEVGHRQRVACDLSWSPLFLLLFNFGKAPLALNHFMPTARITVSSLLPAPHRDVLHRILALRVVFLKDLVEQTAAGTPSAPPCAYFSLSNTLSNVFEAVISAVMYLSSLEHHRAAS